MGELKDEILKLREDNLKLREEMIAKEKKFNEQVKNTGW